jgi:hypothetical protein
MERLKLAKKEDIDWEKLGDEDRISKFMYSNGSEAKKHFGQFKSLEQSTSVGNIAHATSEALSAINALRDQKDQFTSISQIESFIEKISGEQGHEESVKPLREILQKRQEVIDTFKQNAKILGRDNSEVDDIIDIATRRGQNAYGALQSYVSGMTGGEY